MAVYEFSGVTVRDAQGLPAAGATGTLYDKDDASFSTPLTVTDLNGLPLVLTADQFGQLPDFQIDHSEPRAVWKPSDPTMSTTSLLSLDGVVEMGAAAEAAAASSASSAAASASSAASTASSVAALDSWMKLGVTRYNRVRNPRAVATGTPMIASANAVEEFVTGVVQSVIPGVTTGHRYTRDVASGVITGAFDYPFTPPFTAVTAGQAWAGGLLLIPNATARTVRVLLRWGTEDGTFIGYTYGANVATTAGQPVWLAMTAPAPEGAGSVSLGFQNTGGADIGDAYTVTAGLLRAGDTAPEPADYFDGSMADTDLKGYAWSGAANASVSQMIDYTVITNAATAQAQAAQDAAEDAQTAAEAAQSSAASLASGVVRKVNGVAPDASGNVTVSGGGSGSAVTSVAGKTGAVSLVKGDVGLGQVDNTTDLNKPISTAVQSALNGKLGTSTAIPVSQVTGLQASLDSKSGMNDPVNASRVNAGSGTISGSKVSGVVKTVNGVAPDGAGNVNVSGGGGGGSDVLSVNGKTGAVVLNAADVDALPETYVPPVTSVAGLTGDVVLNKTNVGLGNVDNTADSAKPISTLQQAALDAKAADSAVVKLTGNQTVAGTKTFSAAPVVPDASFTQAKVSGLVAALAGKVSSTTADLQIVVLTAAAYNALPTPRPSNVLYIKVG